MKYIVGNFKMNGDSSMINNWLENFESLSRNKIIVAPPMSHLYKGKDFPKDISLAAQNVSQHSSGPYTGQVSVKMLEDLGVKYCILGHSERRSFANESDEEIFKKFCILKESLITPIICIGEPLDIRKNGKHTDFIANQIEKYKHLSDSIIFAYEPIWAIGSGMVPDKKDIFDMVSFIKESFSFSIKVLYGGSISSKNSSEILSIENLDGVLVGGASLNPKEFANIAQS